MKQAVQVTILGQPYALKSELPAEEVQRVADFANNQVAAVAAGRAANSLDAVVLALLNVSGLYLKARDTGGQADVALTERLERLLARVEQALPATKAAPAVSPATPSLFSGE